MSNNNQQMPPKEVTPPDTAKTTPKGVTLTKLDILGHLSETTKNAAKAETEKKRVAEEAAKEAEAKKETQREDRRKKREEKARLKRIDAEKQKEAAEKMREEEKAIAEYTARNKNKINEQMMGSEDYSDDENFEGGAKKNLFGEDEDVVINSPDYKKGKSNGGGGLKSDWRYSNKAEATRKSGSTTTSYSLGYGRSGLLDHTTYVEIAIELSSEDKPSEFLGGIQGLLKECQLLAETGFVELSHQVGKEPLVIKNVSALPTSYTLLSKFCNIKSDNPFKPNWYDKKKQAGHRDNEEETSFTKTVYATVQFTSTMEISELIKGISTQCAVNGVEKIFIKKVQAAKTKFVALLLFVSLRTSEEAVRHSFQRLCDKVLNAEKVDMSEEDVKWDIPTGIKLQVPTLYNIGGATDNLAWKVKKLRQVFHIEVPVDKEAEVLRIIRKAKELKLIHTAFNAHTIIAEVMTKEDSTLDNEQMMRIIVDVADYNYNMTSIKLSGFTNMSAGVVIAGEGSEAITGLEFLPKVLKVAGGIPLIAEIYQIHPGCDVELIFLDCAEGHHMLAQMQKNPAGYLFHALKKTIDERTVRRMAVGICESVYTAEIDECEWNEETKTLTIPSEKEGNKALECKDSPFWKMAIDLVEKDDSDRKARKKINPETIIDLDQARSIKSIHNRTKKSPQVTFGLDSDVDELSAGSASTIETLDDDNHNTEATGKIPLAEQASTSVVSPKGSVEGSSPAGGG